MLGGAPGPPGKSSLKLHGGRRPPKNFLTRVPPVLIFFKLRAEGAKKILQGSPLCYFFELQKFESLHSSYTKFWLDRGAYLQKICDLLTCMSKTIDFQFRSFSPILCGRVRGGSNISLDHFQALFCKIPLLGDFGNFLDKRRVHSKNIDDFPSIEPNMRGLVWTKSDLPNLDISWFLLNSITGRKLKFRRSRFINNRK